MRVEITEYHEKETCLWCSREAEGVTATFDAGFLGKASLCFRCLQNATKVRAQQDRNRADKK